MARPGASEETRIRKLQDALRRATAHDMLGEVIGQKPFAELLQVQVTTLRPWLEDEEVSASGTFIAGGRGVDYRINPVATIWVLIRWFERKRDERVRENLRIREMVAGDKLDGAPAEMTVRDATEAYRLSLQIITAEKEAGRLVDAAVSEAKFNQLVLALREGLLSAPQKLDPTNEWSPEFRENIDNVLAECLVLLRQAGQDSLSAPDGPVASIPDGPRERAPQRKKARRPRAPRAQSAGSAATA
jgi:hypothetical protein